MAKKYKNRQEFLLDVVDTLKKQYASVVKRIATEYRKQVVNNYYEGIKDFYDDYTPKKYKRTYMLALGIIEALEFYNQGFGSFVDESDIPDHYNNSKNSNYEYQVVSGAYIFNESFINGYHGPRFLNIRTTPPLQPTLQKNNEAFNTIFRDEWAKILKQFGITY